MNNYIFITTEGTTYQPDSESSEPDIENLQVIGFGTGSNPKEALNSLIEKNNYLLETSFDEIFALQLSNDNRDYFSLKNLK